MDFLKSFITKYSGLLHLIFNLGYLSSDLFVCLFRITTLELIFFFFFFFFFLGLHSRDMEVPRLGVEL